ncbi:UDP-N-acetylglucosamine 1-carboxyvinyltransferase [Microbacterium sp. JZ37]|uniref:UDP-N-acetylglucosamine 1-carboxyvinyltransferase n=1 Tax=Microbacterium sp. JZ37 TaxID=2654193 RepID=UPI002B45DDB1|nr:UDP-N-acetylglucosamine 1-carboxyvinyltransferase [Microbacterium sp. JZ37]WRH18251.1 UDP-N-acetylglucosamine 1-carboxyvinyltransferase [Microbacterium sp. JZ37]
MEAEPKTLSVTASRLEGTVRVDGAKNSALRLLAASLLTADDVELTNYPSELLDAKIHVGMLGALGKTVELLSDSHVRITEKAGLPSSNLVWDGRSIRNTLLILGALTARTGAGSVPLPGGCRLGERKYDLHVHVLEALGARVWDDASYLHAEAPAGGLIGADIHLRLRSTGATENAILAATLAKGTTRIWNPHIRPEIIDLVSMLNSAGARIKVHGQEHIEVEGVEELSSVRHRVIPDNMEAITWLVAAGVSGGEIEIEDFPYGDLQAALMHLESSGATLYRGENSLIVRGEKCYPFEISTGPHPGINSDVQPILAAWAAKARGESRIVDLRFRGRYDYAGELSKMGVESVVDGDMLRISGSGGQLQGAEVRALDLRAGASFALCGLMAEGETTVTDAWQIARGYVGFAEKLRSLGAHAQWGY